MLRLQDEFRDLFRRPFGILFPDISDVIPLLSGRVVYAVGDVVTDSLLSRGIFPDIAVIDGYTMRSPFLRTPLYAGASHIRVNNPAGMITPDLIAGIERALADPPALVFVDGEEDLAVIPLVIAAPDGVFVLYGQPGEGVVLREIDSAAREEAQVLLSYFTTENASIK
ncbi:MAG: hypothetical protein XE11_0178 [Methanomicrobiales archaeon 53_19]|jgi:hypothetical protein|uniref:GTP-dependent dephospho-CoA kinase family protein n=1 Tax=Methanocalculus sp. TaxID=2004547 RepID=UPI0007498477|nr:GTP-dependent dephospho-CoA kinase family protein [Methanocalculus sp.]KUK69078.1 MAG: hypothetical protein XD88_1562 [Methanocalculus sp. 52_23]KUL05023.1 MAG: hypothetical protein XE11_0178 [Methanomicrobiales archaeon 53_19]HIJ05971.1 DUF359 domain-containing protein [Methanocalculus sp.]